MEDRELRERLSRIEKHLGMEPYDKEVKKTDRIGELLLFIAEKRKEVKEEAFLGYLKKMEEVLCREQVKLDDLSENLYKNYEIYLKRQQEEVLQPEPIQSAEPDSVEELLIAEPFPQATEQPKVLVEPQVKVQPKVVAEPQTTEQPKEVVESRLAKKKDMEFGIGAVVLSIVGALFIDRKSVV